MSAVGVGGTIGRYRLDSVLGVGGMGVVYAATDTTLGRRVALKVMTGAVAASPAFRARFQREAEVLARLDSPHVVTIHDHGEHDGVPYLVTQLVPGGDLGALLRRRGPLPPGLALQVVAQVADALDAAHRAGVVHRDVKPSNVLVRDPDAPDLHVVLCDFGIADTPGDQLTALTHPGDVAGTTGFLSPERARGAPGSPASDVYALGCVLWAALVGRPPFTGSDVEVVLARERGHVPQLEGRTDLVGGLNGILRRTLARDPARHTSDAAVVATELRRLSASLEPGSRVRAGAPLRRRSGAVAAVAATVAVLLGAGIAGWWSVSRSEDDDGAPTAGVPSTSATSGEPAPPRGDVTGDLDGDGFGDLVTTAITVDEPVTVALQRSDGTGLNDGQTLRSPAPLESFDQQVVGDFDGDGRDELVSARPRADDRISLVWHDGSRREEVQSEGYDVVVGDYDGDGRDDVAVLDETAAARSDLLRVRVALVGEGFVADAEQWLELDGWDASSEVAPADVDGDGRDDLVLQQTGPPLARDATRRDSRLRVARSNGGGFDLGPERTYPDGGSTVARAGDFDGDGADEVALVPIFFDARVLVVDGVEQERGGGEADQAADLSATTRQAPPPVNPDLRQLDTLAVSDVDGDGFDDLVVALGWFRGSSPVVVLAGGPEGLTAAQPWGETPGAGDEVTTVFAARSPYLP